MLTLLNGVGKAAAPVTPFVSTPSQLFDFQATTSLPPEWTYTGNGGVGTYRDSNGDLQASTNSQPRFDHDESGNPLGVLCEEERTNKTIGVNYNPTSGDESSAFTVISGTGTISVVSKSSELVAAGLDGICTNGNVYKLESTGGDALRVTIDGNAGNTNAHSWCAWLAYGDTFYHGTMKVTGASGDKQVLLQDTTANYGDFRKVCMENYAPDNAAREVEINLGDGRTLYLILFDFQEGAFMTSPILNSGGGTKTRTRDSLYDLGIASRSYWNSVSGTIIANVRHLVDENISDQYVYHASESGGFTNSVGMQTATPRSKYISRIYGDSTNQIVGDVNGFKAGRRAPFAIGWENGGNAYAISGNMGGRENAMTDNVISINRFDLGGREFGQDFNGHIQSLKIYAAKRSMAQAGKEMIISGNRVLLAGGQSNMAGYFADQNEGKNDGEKAFLAEYDVYKTATENFVIAGATPGSAALKANNATNWWYDDVSETFGPAYDTWLIAAQGAANATIDALIWDQGESDVSSTKADYKAAVLTIFNQMRSVAGSLPVIIIPIGGRTDSEESGYQTIREAQWELASENSWIHLAPEKFDNELEASGTHLTASGYAANAPRVIRKIMDVIGETVSGGVDGPVIAGASRAGTTVTVTLSHDAGTDFTPTSNIEGFVFLDDGSPITISSAVRTSATTITLTLAGTPSGTEELYYGYRALYGATLSNLVKDNSSETLPLRSTKIVL